jgi:enamine deaminase RidA (YjgF/YER057c/UK114 family)
VGYANGVAAQGRQIFVAGQIGWDPSGVLAPGLVPQVRQALENVVAVMRAGSAEPRHLVRMTWYVVDREAYRSARREIGQVYREVIGAHFPAMTLVQVAALLEDGALVEIEATAVIPE